MKATKLPASSSALSEQRRARIADVDPARRGAARTSSGKIVATSRAERQNDTSQAGRSMRRTMTPAVLKTVAAPTAQATPSAAELCGGSLRFHAQTNCEYGFDVPPSIDSLELPPFRPRFPWWGADLQTIAVLLAAYQVGPGAAHQRARVLSDGRSQRRHPARHARPAGGAAGRPAAGDSGARPHRLRGQLVRPERARAICSIAAIASCASTCAAAAPRGPIAASTTMSAAPPISAACCRSCPTT